MKITTVNNTKEIPVKYEYLPIPPGKLDQCLAELKRRWSWYDPAESWYLRGNSTLYVPAQLEAK